MFKKLKKHNPKSKTQVSVFSCNNELLFNGELHSLPIKESVIISKSIEFFNDSNPCYIHRGAVTVRLLSEIEDFLKMNGDKVIYESCVGSVIDYIDMDGIHRMEFS